MLLRRFLNVLKDVAVYIHGLDSADRFVADKGPAERFGSCEYRDLT